MLRYLRIDRRMFGKAPGARTEKADRDAEATTIKIHNISPEDYSVSEHKPGEELPAMRGFMYRWVEVTGFGDPESINKLCEEIGLHPLAAEDIFSPSQSVKYEAYSEYIFSVLKFSRTPSGEEPEVLNVSAVLMKDTVVTFASYLTPTLEPIKRRLEKPSTRLRSIGEDYFFYALADLAVDSFLITMDTLVQRIEKIEEALVMGEDLTMERVYSLKKQVMLLRRMSLPFADIADRIINDETGIITRQTGIFARDLDDHSKHLNSISDSVLSLAGDMFNLHIATSGNKMNEIMKVLTIFASIFIPLTFVAGIYGMNFKYMPELETRWGYPVLLSLMAAMLVGMLYYFRRKKWI
ncbi:magnesium/cobalt transporter CorA [Limisalsivibrio acetivorans]|uniref:magnesium/cobalt transporter CorA n=1 Tax=Limisalsivibrio acetivorans TaxID=1304888 RepID=UPI0003B7AA63|nr:magnesium/cobalt transporter CorA [Limisalsivibrio acetivorans]